MRGGRKDRELKLEIFGTNRIQLPSNIVPDHYDLFVSPALEQLRFVGTVPNLLASWRNTGFGAIVGS
jgi:hypothetical protein